MLGYYAHYSQYYITVLMLTTTLFFALPIFVAPITWARLMGWTIPEHQHLAIYFGRCLGAFILVIEVAMLRSATTGTSFNYLHQHLSHGIGNTRRDNLITLGYFSNA